MTVGSFADHSRWTYFLDLHEHLRSFHPELRFHYLFGDDIRPQAAPTLAKARWISEDDRNPVLLKLNRVRHFRFVRDPWTWEQKRPYVVWRGKVNKPHRLEMLRALSDHPRCDVGHVGGKLAEPEHGRGFLSIREQLRSRYVLVVEGNDVATSLKWAMASRSLCLMVPPKRESWFLESWLVPGEQFVPLAEDYSNLDEVIDHYESHPDEAREIVANAHQHVARFSDPRRERAIALLVLDRYFRCTGQARWLPHTVSDTLR